ncbi:MAG: zinc dependent phospholipase C family protein [Clostridia bacterium]|nr:zinc dependent phospholipase C family protein [Clostridia bacterium]
MPASYVHQSIAADACRRLGVYSAAPLSCAVRAGAEGPDPLFFSFTSAITSPGLRFLPRLAAMIHTQRTDEFLLSLMDACRGDALLEAYCCGFLSHYAADTVCHPFIYAHSLTARGRYSSTMHSALEHALDTLLYRRRGHAQGLPEQMAGLASLPPSAKDSAARAITHAAHRTFPGAAPQETAIRRSLDQSVSLTRLLRPGESRRVAAAAHLPFGAGRALRAHMLPPEPPPCDVANDARAPWASIWTPQEKRTESFFDLVEAAISRSCDLIEAAQQYFSGACAYAGMRAMLGGLSYASGLPWCGSSPASGAPGTRRSAAG